MIEITVYVCAYAHRQVQAITAAAQNSRRGCIDPSQLVEGIIDDRKCAVKVGMKSSSFTQSRQTREARTRRYPGSVKGFRL